MEPKEPPKKKAPHFSKLSVIAPGQHGYNVYVKVLEAEFTTAKKQDQSELKIVQAKVGDETACINVRVVGEYADLFKVNNVIAIRNGKSEVFKENHRLEIDRWGKVTLEPNVTIEKVNTEKNLSSILYETRLLAKERRDDRD